MGGAGESISSAAPEGVDFPALAPEVILQTIRKSSSGRYLMEQRAVLAELSYFDDLDDEELRQFAAHVRPWFYRIQGRLLSRSPFKKVPL